jgi:A/G-specific adenine glycosylase
VSLDAQAGAAAALLAWYDRHRRDLPWRAAPGERADPYKVWLSEIMLQQTTVAAVRSYFETFVARWPDVASLAQARREEVMRQWAGLGYYSRARNLHACAKIVAVELAGTFPDTEAGLQRLPGIGPYTAGAIAAIAFGRRTVAVDGNTERVIARLLSIDAPQPRVKSEVKARAARLVPVERPGDFAQAMMDLGATICSPKDPSCSVCPLQGFCAGYASGSPQSLPRKAPRRERPVRHGAAFFVRRVDGSVLVRSRPPKGLLGGMAEVPGTHWDTHFDRASAIKQAPLEASYRKLDQAVAHVFTHFALQLDVYVAEVSTKQHAPAGCRFVAECDLDKEAFPSVMRKVIEAAQRSGAHEQYVAEGAAIRRQKLWRKKDGPISEAS